MNGIWLNGVFYSKPRSMARFGSLILRKGLWDNKQLLMDSNYFHDMTNTSQNLNQSYGYLWWLNGKSSFRLPGTVFQVPGKLIPQAPDDMFCGLGKYDQKLYIWPKENIVIIRMGNAADSSDVPIALDTLLWKALDKVFCHSTAIHSITWKESALEIYPNPMADELELITTSEIKEIHWSDMKGTLTLIPFSMIRPNTYRLTIKDIHAQLGMLLIQDNNGKVIRRKLLKTD
jgi:CubicO group peptidase (beta-lactamase class C family)